jgi:hypothetical protein
MAVDPERVWTISPENRERLEEMGEPYVRQMCSGKEGFPHPFSVCAQAWLAERDDATRKRAEALQAEQTRFQTEQTQLSKSTLRAAWIAASFAAVGVIVATAISYGQYRIAKFEVAHNKRIRDGISSYIQLGHGLMGELRSNPNAVLSGQNEWVSNVDKFLHNNLDDHYVARFADQSNMPLTGTSAVDQENAYSDFASRIDILEEIRRELR